MGGSKKKKQKQKQKEEKVDPCFDAGAHTIISLDAVLTKDIDSINQLKQEFTKRGWCIVQLPKTYSSAWNKKYAWFTIHYDLCIPKAFHQQALASFFALPKDNKEASYGYSAVPHKESIHLRTGPNNWDSSTKIDSSIQEFMVNSMRLWDDLTTELLDVIAEPIFECTGATLAHRADIPLAYGYQQAGMLDVAYYKNEKSAISSPPIGHSTKEVNCVPHYDPGLLSISFLSTLDGLQLKDPTTNTWFAGPVNTVEGQEELGVVWLGAAATTASKGAFPAAVHRVVYPKVATPRITMWYEICTVEQNNQDLIDTRPTTGSTKLPNLPDSKPVYLYGDPDRIERYYGLPRSKVMLKSDKFSANYSTDYQANKLTYEEIARRKRLEQKKKCSIL